MIWLCQSGSILLYLAEKFGKMGGKTTEDKARVREWLFWEFDVANVYRPRAIKRGARRPTTTSTSSTPNREHDMGREASLDKSSFLVGNRRPWRVAVYGDVASAKPPSISHHTRMKAWMEREKLPGFKVRGRAAQEDAA